MRNSRLQRYLANVALVAMLLLAFAPSLSRWLVSNNADAAWTEICTISGMKLVQISDFNQAALPEPMPMGQDCAYCPLATTIAALLIAIAIIFPRISERFISHSQHIIHRTFLYPSGLGSRGPPIIL
jgi:Protein of unknown function (DUF2946)